MTSERWQKIEELFHAALQREPYEHTSFLDEACDGDLELRQQVEALLGSLAEAGDFIEEPPLAGAISSVVEGSADQAEQRAAANGSLIGRRIGHYEIQSLLGAGGMGEVYLARDLKLDRPVALKMLPAAFIQDEAQVRRFEREARAASGLNNPNIITIQIYEKLTDSGASPRWLSDNRRLLFLNEGALQVVDSLTKRVETVMEIAPDAFFGFALPKNQRLIYFTQASSEIDIWLSEIQ